MPWSEDPELGSIAVNWAESLYFANKLNSGHLPLWDPYIGGGVPTIDNGQSRPFNPFRLLYYLFPTTWVYSLTLLAGLIFGGVGAYLWLTRNGHSLSGVVLGTGLFVLNPWVLERLVLTDSAAYFVLPWCLIAFDDAVLGNWPSICRAVLCFIVMGHSGHPEMSILMAVVAVSFVVLDQEKREGSNGRVSEKVKTVGVIGAFTLACLTVLWLPSLRLFLIGDIYKKYASVIHEESWKSLIAVPSNMFIPPAIGTLLACTPYAWNKISKTWVISFVAVVFVLFPLPGIGTLPSKLLWSLGLPTFYLKGVFWASVAFLAPYGLEAYRASNKGAGVAGFAVGVALLIVVAWQFIGLPMARGDISAFPMTVFVLLALGLLVLVISRAARGKFLTLLVPVLVLVPLAFPLSTNKLLWNTIDFKTNPVVEWLKINRPNARTVSVNQGAISPIPPNLSQAYGIRSVEMIGVMFLNHYRSMFHHPRSLPTGIHFDFLSLDAFRLMGADVALLPNEADSSGMDLLVKGALFSAYSIPGAHGRLYFAERASHFEASSNFASQILSLCQETDAVAVVEGMGNLLPSTIPEVPYGNGKAVFERDDTEDVLVRTECPSEGLLVLRDSWYSGWAAFMDGKITPIFRVNGCFRGVIVPPGRHAVRFVYRPTLVYVAGLVSLLSSVIAIIISIGTRLNSRGRTQ
jgi:hypothetical protein